MRNTFSRHPRGFQFLATLLAALSLTIPIFAAPTVDPTLPKCPPDWKVELIAQPPALVHPSVVCAAPDGRVFVAQDPIDMGLPSDSASDSILCFHPDGRITKFADNLHAVFGLSYLEGKLYVHHTPLFSVFTDGGEIGTDRADLFTTNPHPSLDGHGFNDHIPSNIRFGMDGWFYMSTGDKGIFQAQGKDGSKAEIHGGGIMRFRPDGTHLEVYCSGTRNHLDVAINDEDELFTYDNTDDGNGWWTRVTHMVDGGYYGYPYDYKPRRPYTLWMMTDYGGGSPTGALAYNEDALPLEYRGNLFLCEWGRRQLLRLKVSREGGTYKIDSRVQTEGADFLTSGTKPFRPAGIAVSPDGMSFYIADWNYDGWKANVVAGRLLKLTYMGKSLASPKPAWWIPGAEGKSVNATTEELIAALNHPARNVRTVAQRLLIARGRSAVPELKALLADTSAPSHARWHAIWTLDGIDDGLSARKELLAIVKADKNLSVRAQAIRELGTQKTREAIRPLQAALSDPEPVIRFRAATALGRIGDVSAVPALSKDLDEKDFFTRYAVFTALTRIGRENPKTWDLLEPSLASEKAAVREGALFAMRETFDQENARVLASFVKSKKPAADRAAALAVLAELHRQRPPWDGKWWATQPVKGAPVPKTVDWAGTPTVLASVESALDDGSPAVQRVAVEGVAITSDLSAAPRVRQMFAATSDSDLRQAIIRTLGQLKDEEAGQLVAQVLADNSGDNHLISVAIDAAGRLATKTTTEALIKVASSINDPEMLQHTLQAIGQTKSAEAIPAVAKLLQSPSGSVRSAAAEAMGNIGGEQALASVTPLLDDPQIDIQKTAITTAGLLRRKEILPKLLALAENRATRQETTLALAKMPDIRALDNYIDGLTNRNGTVRDSSRRAIESVREKALPLIEEKQRQKPFSGQALAELQRVYTGNAKARQGPLFEGEAKPTSPEAYLAFAERNPGDPKQGRKIVEGEIGCVLCHRINGKGGEVGPDLSGVGSKYARLFLIESVLYPSKQILDGYHTSNITLKNGDVLSGLVRSETAGEVVLVDAAAQPHAVPNAQIEKREESKVSLMPEGLHAALSLSDFTSLIAYLETLKEPPTRSGK